MPQVPSNWALANSPLLIRTQQMVAFVLDDIDVFVDTNDLSAGPAVGANFTMLVNGLVPGPVARVLCVTYVPVGGAARTIAVRINGVNQFGAVVQEVVDFSTGAGTPGVTYGKATRNAYRYVTSITYLSRAGGAVQANDRLDVGIAATAATFAGTILDNGNGLGTSNTQCKGFGLAVPLGVDQAVGAILAADFPSQVAGMAVSEAATGETTFAALLKTGNFNIDLPFSVMVCDEVLVIAPGAGIQYLLLDLQTNRGE